jgi:co-chaperonin GroES (HSP10)
MAKKKIELDKEGLPSVLTVGTKFAPFTKLAPVGNLVLIERLFESELNQTNLALGGDDKPSKQALIVAIGPLVNKDLGLKVGDRVLVGGTFVAVPDTPSGEREKNLVLPDMIKAVLS